MFSTVLSHLSNRDFIGSLCTSNMPTKYCFLCASDEGVFLDVTTENKQTFCTQFETCSLVKVPTSDQLPIKICHKCAYELNQCSEFLEKYKKATKSKTYNQRKCCSLCFKQRSREYTFDLSKENTLELTFINKIQQILNDKGNTIQRNNIVVCLFCRYTVDVLCDLKNLSNGIASKLDTKLGENIDYSSFPKVKTTVISRKTTITESERATLKAKQTTENDSDGMMRTRSKYNLKDIEAQSPAETKVCKVFLKDVLNQKAAKKAKQVNETKKDVENKGKQKATARQLRSLNSDTESDIKKQPEKRPIKSVNISDSDNKDMPNKKSKRGQKETVKEREQSPPSEPVLGRLRRNRKAAANEKPVLEITDSDNPLSINNVKEVKGPLTKIKKITGTSLSDADVEIKSDRKQLKSILAGISSPKGSDANDESLSDDGVPKKKKLRFNSDAPIYIDLTTQSDERERPRRNATRRGTVQTKTIGKPPLVKKSPQNSEIEVETDSTIEEEEIKTYSCEKCGVNYENKLALLTHKLTHYKQPKLELEKVVVASKPNAVSQNASEAEDELSEDQSEVIRITVDDDEEEAELESNNLDSSADTNLSSSRVEEVAASAEIPVSLNSTLLTPKDAVEPEVPSKELDSDQPTEKDDKDKKSLRGQRSRSVSASTDKASAENVTELVEEENVEDISLTNIEDNQEEEEEKEKEVDRESERKEKAVDRESERKEKAVDQESESKEKAVDRESERKEKAVDQESESKEKAVDRESERKEKAVDQESESKEKAVDRESERKEKTEDGKAADSEDATAGAVAEEKEAEEQDKEKPEETISIEKLGGDVDEDKLDSSQKIEADKTQGEAKLDSSDGSEEKNDTPLLEKPEENQVEEKESRNSSDVLEENLKEKEKLEISENSEANIVEVNLDSPDKSEEVRLNEKDKTDSPSRSEERRVTRAKRSVTFATLEEKGKQSSPENSREKSSSPDKSEGRKSSRRTRSSTIARLEEDKRESSEERKSTRKTRSSPLKKIEEDKQNSPEKSEGKDKLGSPTRSKERKSIKKGKVAEDKKESAEKPEEEESEENKATRNNKSNLIEKSEEEDKQASSEKSKDEPVSSENFDEHKSEKKRTDKDDAVIEIADDDSMDSVKEVCENQCNNEIDIDDVVEVVDSNDETTCNVEEVCEKKDDDQNEAEEVQCVETNCSDKSSNKKSNDAQRNDEDIVEVDASTQPMPTSDSADAVSEILQLVLDLASTEIQKREDSAEIVGEDDSEDAETLENISREVQSGGDTRP